MSDTVTLEPAEEIPSDCRVCHYDELGEEAKAEVPSLADEVTAADGSSVTVEPSVADEFGDCDLVKYTDYYEISS